MFLRRISNLAKSYFLGCSALCNFAIGHACDGFSAPAAIIGGQGNAPYAAFIETNGSVVTLPGLPPTGLTYRVAINSLGVGLVGGTNGVNAYAALVAPNGTLAPIQGLLAPGEIYFVSINEAGRGIVGGGHASTNVPYAALISQYGTAFPLAGLPSSGLLYGVAIENNGTGIIGGIGPANSAYAALFSPNGTLTPLTGLPATGAIFWVSVTQGGSSLIGGQDGANAYAAFVDPQGTILPVQGLPAGTLYSVHVNDIGFGILGGTASSMPYAAFVAPNGRSLAIQGLPTANGIIYNVVRNNSGTGLITGFAASVPYGALISPSGTLIPLKGLPTGAGFLDGAALDESGVAIVGGTTDNVPFAALVAPDGTLTFLSGLPTQGQINSIAIATFEDLVPRALGPYDSLANTQFLFSETLTQHHLFPHACCQLTDCCTTQENYSLWLAPFWNYVQQQARQHIPRYTNQIGGALLGLDYFYSPDVIAGAGIAYAYNDVQYSRHLGHTGINQESGVIYLSMDKPLFNMNLALWGGGFQATYHRNSFTFITSRSKPNGWTLSPHLEINKSCTLASCQNYICEPFYMFDLANSWLYDYHERGDSGFNIALHEYYAAVMRNEIGVRFYETIEYDWGCLVLEEKGSYVNRTPVSGTRHSAHFIGAFSTFDIKTLGTSGQNHAAIALHMECIPSDSRNVYASLDYQGEFGISFQSHALIASIGKNF